MLFINAKMCISSTHRSMHSMYMAIRRLLRLHEQTDLPCFAPRTATISWTISTITNCSRTMHTSLHMQCNSHRLRRILNNRVRSTHSTLLTILQWTIATWPTPIIRISSIVWWTTGCQTCRECRSANINHLANHRYHLIICRQRTMPQHQFRATIRTMFVKIYLSRITLVRQFRAAIKTQRIAICAAKQLTTASKWAIKQRPIAKNHSCKVICTR